MSTLQRAVAWMLAVLLASQSLAPCTVWADPPCTWADWVRSLKRRTIENRRPHAEQQWDVERVAREIDWLEHVVERYGTVAPKHPDVWGEARLTKHRREYEEQIKSLFAKNEFKQTLQGAIRRSDQALVSLALALNNAPLAADGSLQPNQAVAIIGKEFPNTQTSDPLDPIGVQFKNAADAEAGGGEVLSLEPTVVADQFSRYLNHLNELRRINEGDDTADSPGYALNLVRIPVSVLPGKHTREGYGAEITFTITPHLSDDLLPSTMRQLIVNDVVDQHALPIAAFLNNHPEHAALSLGLYRKHASRVNKWMKGYDAWLAAMGQLGATDLDGKLRYFHSIRSYLHMRLIQVADAAASSQQAKFREVLRREGEDLEAIIEIDAKTMATLLDEMTRTALAEPVTADRPPHATLQTKLQLNVVGTNSKPILACATILVRLCRDEPLRSLDISGGALPLEFSCTINEDAKRLEEAIKEALKTRACPQPNSLAAFMKSFVGKALTLPSYSGTISVALDALPTNSYAHAQYCGLAAAPGHTRHAERALCPSQYIATVGFDHFMNLTLESKAALELQPPNDGLKHVADVRRYLSEEALKAYRLLDRQDGGMLWGYASPDLAHAVRVRNYADVNQERSKFMQSLGPDLAETATATLAWGIIVEAALLNARLQEDMTRTAAAKGDCGCLGDAERVSFIGPAPTLLPEAHETFKQYVRCRWPVIVFALDPVTQDQNVADSFSRRRELQLAVAVAVAKGKLNPNFAGKFVRQLETDIETIALNRTAIAFSHGNDTFGWRFYPRVQTPEVPGQIGAFAQTLIGGPSRDHDIRRTRLEPGQRECTAVVIMPSFVPYVTIDSRANWFGLTNPEKKELTLHDTMRISRNFQQIRGWEHVACTSNLYRPTDLAQMSRVLDQIERKLPLQTASVQVPYLNTLGGFDMFETGVTTLGPRLDGWYGAPGIDPAKPTTLYLVGDKFNIHETRIIAGGREIETSKMNLLSRQVLMVTIPEGVQPLGGKYPDRVDVVAATPYGVSSHLLVPLVKPEVKAEKKQVSLSKSPDLRAVYCFDAATGRAVVADAPIDEDTLEIKHDMEPKFALPDEADVGVRIFLNGSGGLEVKAGDAFLGLLKVSEKEPTKERTIEVPLADLLKGVKPKLQAAVTQPEFSGTITGRIEVYVRFGNDAQVFKAGEVKLQLAQSCEPCCVAAPAKPAADGTDPGDPAGKPAPTPAAPKAPPAKPVPEQSLRMPVKPAPEALEETHLAPAPQARRIRMVR